MAKKSSIAKQKKRERMVKTKWEKRHALKQVILDMTKPIEERLNAVDTLNKMPKNSSPVRLRNRCQLTGRARGFLRKFKLSRLCFREMANQVSSRVLLRRAGNQILKELPFRKLFVPYIRSKRNLSLSPSVAQAV